MAGSTSRFSRPAKKRADRCGAIALQSRIARERLPPNGIVTTLSAMSAAPSQRRKQALRQNQTARKYTSFRPVLRGAPRNCRQTSTIRRTASSTSAGVVVSPRLKRSELATSSLGRPIARSVGDSSLDPLAQAEPDRAGYAGQVQCQEEDLPLQAGEGDVAGVGSRGAAVRGPPPRDSRPRRPASNRSRSAVSRRACSSCSWHRSSRAVCMPTARATVWVPGRRPPSW